MTRGQHLIGTVLNSCILERLLGYGGSSAVFLARQSNPDRKVAVKVFLPRSTMDAQTRREFYLRFLREAEAASHLDHPNIMPIYSYGEQDGLPYITMPYVPGGTVAEYITKHGPLSVQEALSCLEQITSALGYAHAHNVVHCDVKPANILLDEEKRAILADFGIARSLSSLESSTSKNSNEKEVVAKNTEILLGTPDYISPEQALGHPLDGRSDIYSLGITLFYLLAKRLPFKADSSIALALAHVHEPPPSLVLLRADISPAVDRVIQKALAKNPDERFQSVEEFCQAFAQAVNTPQRISLSGLRTASIGTSTFISSSQALPFAPKPIVNIKRVSSLPGRYLTVEHSSRPQRPLRLAMIALVLLVFIGATIAAIPLASQRLFQKTPGMQTSLSAGLNHTPPTRVDYLANHDNWPISSTFFYDTDKQHYHILNKSDQNVALALYNNSQFSNFRLTVTMNEVHRARSGGDYYGVVFRSSADQSHYYLFEVSTSAAGQYAFWRYDSKWKTLATGPTSSLFTGVEKSNTITVVARNNAFTFLVNEKPIGDPVTDTSDSPLTTGAVGLYVEQQDAEVAFSHLYIDSLK